MFGIILVLAVSSVGVQSQLRAPPGRRPISPTLNKAVMRAEPSLRKFKPCTEVITITSQTTIPSVVPAVPATLPAALPAALQAALPAALPAAMPGIPFVTELPSCPDLYFQDILSSPLGCLGPILNVYSTATDIMPDLPVSPLLPAASPVSAAAPPFSKLLPPALPHDGDSLFAKRVPIPPPFI